MGEKTSEEDDISQEMVVAVGAQRWISGIEEPISGRHELGGRSVERDTRGKSFAKSRLEGYKSLPDGAREVWNRR